MALIWSKLAHGNIPLAAPRRFGKTSVMYRAEEMAAVAAAPSWLGELVTRNQDACDRSAQRWDLGRA